MKPFKDIASDHLRLKTDTTKHVAKNDIVEALSVRGNPDQLIKQYTKKMPGKSVIE